MTKYSIKTSIFNLVNITRKKVKDTCWCNVLILLNLRQFKGNIFMSLTCKHKIIVISWQRRVSDRSVKRSTGKLAKLVTWILGWFSPPADGHMWKTEESNEMKHVSLSQYQDTWRTKHSYEDDDVHVVDREDRWFERRVKEAVSVSTERPWLNRAGLRYQLSPPPLQRWRPFPGPLNLVHNSPVTVTSPMMAERDHESLVSCSSNLLIDHNLLLTLSCADRGSTTQVTTSKL